MVYSNKETDHPKVGPCINSFSIQEKTTKMQK